MCVFGYIYELCLFGWRWWCMWYGCDVYEICRCVYVDVYVVYVVWDCEICVCVDVCVVYVVWV